VSGSDDREPRPADDPLRERLISSEILRKSRVLEFRIVAVFQAIQQFLDVLFRGLLAVAFFLEVANQLDIFQADAILLHK